MLRSESKNLTTATLQSGQEEAISSIDHHFPENDSANRGDLVQNGFHDDPDANQISGRHLLKYAYPQSGCVFLSSLPLPPSFPLFLSPLQACVYTGFCYFVTLGPSRTLLQAVFDLNG